MAQPAASTTEKPDFTGAFSSFSTNDITAAKAFYGDRLGLDVEETKEGLQLTFDSGQSVFIYPKDDHEPANFTVLNLMVDDITGAVDQLRLLGVDLESYSGEIQTDENGIMWGEKHDGGGPNIAWFKDPAGNFVSVIEKRQETSK